MLPDIELAVTAWARDEFDVRVCTELPADLDDVLPVIQIEAIGGTGTRFSSDPRVDVDVYAADFEAARDLAKSVHAGLMLLRGTVGALVIRHVRADSLPSRRPYDNSGLRRVGASYTISARPA